MLSFNFKPVRLAGLVMVILLIGTLAESATGAAAYPVAQEDAAPRIPLTEMGEQLYYGFEGGLYPGGRNQMPVDHAAEGLARAGQIQPLDEAGNPDPNGRYIFLSIGMSNTAVEFCSHRPDGVSCLDNSFMALADETGGLNRDELVIVNGAKGGQSADFWDAPDEANYDRIRDDILAPLGLSENQVQVIWVKLANRRVSRLPRLPSDEADAYRLLFRLGNVMRAVRVRYPNVKQVFLSSRAYGGYASERATNPEPYAYESGFAVKWLIEAQIQQMAGEGAPGDTLAGDLDYTTVAPWLAWGPYLWADGATMRADGLLWQRADFQNDGIHPSERGQAKIAGLLLAFFSRSNMTQPWFIERQLCAGCNWYYLVEVGSVMFFL